MVGSSHTEMKVTQTTEAVIYTLNWKLPEDSTPIQFLILQMKKLKPKEAIYISCQIVTKRSEGQRTVDQDTWLI